MTLHELEQLIGRLSRAERAQVLQWVARDLGATFPGIEQRDGVAGGAACIVRTRIPVWVLVEMWRQGADEATILQSYPSLRAEDLVNAWAYARAHRDEIDREIHENALA